MTNLTMCQWPVVSQFLKKVIVSYLWKLKALVRSKRGYSFRKNIQGLTWLPVLWQSCLWSCKWPLETPGNSPGRRQRIPNVRWRTSPSSALKEVFNVVSSWLNSKTDHELQKIVRPYTEFVSPCQIIRVMLWGPICMYICYRMNSWELPWWSSGWDFTFQCRRCGSDPRLGS